MILYRFDEPDDERKSERERKRADWDLRIVSSESSIYNILCYHNVIYQPVARVERFSFLNLEVEEE